MTKKLLIIATNNIGYGLSGGDRIMLNLIKSWKKNFSISVIGSTETENLLFRYKIKPDNFFTLNNKPISRYLNAFELLLHQIFRSIDSVVYLLKNRRTFLNFDYVYSASDFYPDFFTAFILKLLNYKIKWIASYYLFAPNPLSPASPYRKTGQTIRGLIFYLGQIPSYFFIKYFSNYIFVTSQPDLYKFTSQQQSSRKVFVIQGGVDQVDYQTYLKSSKYIKPNNRKYDAVFIGRFHPQKGVLELVSIWHKVTRLLPHAKLIMIGNGELEPQVKDLVSKLNLDKNITLTGFVDGQVKNKIFQNSKIVVHPAFYDSGGMAMAEAMSWGLPGVSFNLEALKTYYPKGVLKAKEGSQKSFANNIIKLISDEKLYHQLSSQAVDLIFNNWNWNTRFQNIYQNIQNENFL